MIVSIMQPAYLPWLGYFNRMQLSQLTIVLDHVQMDMSSKTRFANRNKIRLPDGWTWLTVPIETKGLHGSLFLNQVRINNDEHWSRKAWRSVESNYRRSPHFKRYAEEFEPIFLSDWTLLSDLNWKLTQVLMRALSIDLPVVFSSSLGVNSKSSELIVDLCLKVGAKTYISGPFGRDYLDTAAFVESDIDLTFHDYNHPEYAQAFPGFQPYMSAIDVLFNHGPAAPKIISQGQNLSRV